MKQKRLVHVALLIWLVLLIGCSESYDFTSYDFATDGPFVTASISPAGPDDYRNLISTHVTIYDDGTLIISHDEDTETGAPISKAQLTKDEIEHLKELIKEEQFLKLNRDVTMPSDDGSRYSITLFLTDQKKEVAGWNPDHEQFLKIHKHIFSLVNSEDRSKWYKEISEYIWENDALARYDIHQYNEEGPYFELKLETLVPSDGYDNKYYQEIILDIDGHLKLTAKSTGDEERVIRGIQPLESTVSKKLNNSIQQLIADNFWKLNEYTSSDDGELMEHMTVHLEDTSKTVDGYEPDHPRYTVVKEAVLELIDSDTYQEWEQEVIEYYEELNKGKSDQLLTDFDDEILYDISYILAVPKTRKKNDLSKVIKVAFTEIDPSGEQTIGLEIDRKVIHIDPLIMPVGILSLQEQEEVEGLEEVINILEKHNIQEWEEDFTLEDSFSLEDPYSWGLWIQFEDGMVEEHKGSGSVKQDMIPDNFTDFTNELKKFVEEIGDNK